MRTLKGLFIIISFLGIFYPMPVYGTNYAVEMIPEDAIRLRILPNSNERYDQELKYYIRDEVNMFLSDHMSDAQSIEEARMKMHELLPEIHTMIEQIMREENIDMPFTVQFKRDIPFPEKTYGKYLYPAGDYEALLITLGDGEGDNWWCVLFPSLCYLDLSQEEKDRMDEADRVEGKQEKKTVKVFLFEWLGFT